MHPYRPLKPPTGIPSPKCNCAMTFVCPIHCAHVLISSLFSSPPLALLLPSGKIFFQHLRRAGKHAQICVLRPQSGNRSSPRVLAAPSVIAAWKPSCLSCSAKRFKAESHACPGGAPAAAARLQLLDMRQCLKVQTGRIQVGITSLCCSCQRQADCSRDCTA